MRQEPELINGPYGNASLTGLVVSTYVLGMIVLCEKLPVAYKRLRAALVELLERLHGWHHLKLYLRSILETASCIKHFLRSEMVFTVQEELKILIPPASPLQSSIYKRIGRSRGIEYLQNSFKSISKRLGKPI